MINILFGGNEKVFDGILLCLLSMTKHTNQELNIYILSADVSELNPNFTPLQAKQIEILNQVVKKKNPKSNVNLVIMGQDFNNWINNSQNKLNSYTPFAFLRLFADKVEDLPDKIIYLDTDIMINGDIKELFDIDITNHELGIVRDRYGHFFIKPNYFNSGMLLMNMKNIRKSGLFEKCRKMCKEKKMFMPDQSALNKLA
ncbi:MAG: glycosyltransferase family 8 protein, partial [Clostridia bacterium]|nr:glycosyltransferase family 8 protein [Clostridia bacterium]